jgi:hypothetical protein
VPVCFRGGAAIVITEAIIDGALSFLQFLFSAFPDDSLTYPDLAGIGTTMGNMVGPFNTILPASELAETMGLTLTVVVPAMLVYRLSMFVWGKIPVLGGS